MIPQEAVEEFKKIYETRYKVVLNQEEATDMANRMFNLYLVLLSPNKSDLSASLISKGGDYASVSK